MKKYNVWVKTREKDHPPFGKQRLKKDGLGVTGGETGIIAGVPGEKPAGPPVNFKKFKQDKRVATKTWIDL